MRSSDLMNKTIICMNRGIECGNRQDQFINFVNSIAMTSLVLGNLSQIAKGSRDDLVIISYLFFWTNSLFGSGSEMVFTAEVVWKMVLCIWSRRKVI